jgi:hypothetical protein
MAFAPLKIQSLPSDEISLDRKWRFLLANTVAVVHCFSLDLLLLRGSNPETVGCPFSPVNHSVNPYREELAF